MSSLFLDTSYDQILGLLDEEKSWIESKTFEGQKLTGIIHSDLHAILSRNSISPLDLKAVFYCAGPGFYTGLRVAYGIADIFRLHNIPILSFYSYLIPRLVGHVNYKWITKAYRGEVFVYDSSTDRIDLLLEKDLVNFQFEGDVFTHTPTSIDEKILALFPRVKFSQELLIKNPELIFGSVKSEEKIYYFRPLDEEYKPSL